VTDRPSSSRPASDIAGVTSESRALRWALAGAARAGDAASAVYGTILAASLLIAVGGSPTAMLATIVVTALVFWIAHVHVELLRTVVRRGEHVSWAHARHALAHEWPLAQAALTPMAPLVLAAVGLVGVPMARTIGVSICLVQLIAWGVVISRTAGLGRRATLITVGINAAFGVALIVLKFIVH
jgi:hypothetical protein